MVSKFLPGMKWNAVFIKGIDNPSSIQKEGQSMDKRPTFEQIRNSRINKKLHSALQFLRKMINMYSKLTLKTSGALEGEAGSASCKTSHWKI